jgi:hypothetical protein
VEETGKATDLEKLLSLGRRRCLQRLSIVGKIG